MRVLEPGHLYAMDLLDAPPGAGEGEPLIFVKRTGPDYPGNEGSPYPGVLIQEVLRCCINRVKYVNGQWPHTSNPKVIDNMRHSIYLLEKRAAERHNIEMPYLDIPNIEDYPACKICGHLRVWCEHGKV